MLEEGHCPRGHTLEGCGLAPKSASGLEATSLFTLIQMIEEGMGLGLVPEMTLRAGLLKNSSLIVQPFAAPAPQRGIALVARQSTARKRAFELLGDSIVAEHRTAHAAKLCRRKRGSKSA